VWHCVVWHCVVWHCVVALCYEVVKKEKKSDSINKILLNALFTSHVS